MSQLNKETELRLTNGGRVPLPVNISEAKLIAADEILEGIKLGDPMAEAAFKQHVGVRHRETLTTGDDFIFAFSHLTALEVDNEWEARERTWSEVVDVQTVGTFDAPKVYSIDPEVSGFARPATEPGKPDWVAPIVPEGSPYPEFKFLGELAAGGKIHKAGGAFSLTFEKIVSDLGEIVPQLPTLITEFLLEREEWDVWNGLLTFIDVPANHLQAGTTLDGVAVPADAPLNRNSLDAAVAQLDLREIRGRKLGVSAYTLLVPIGGARVANWYLNTLQINGINEQDGSTERTFTLNNYNPLSKINKVVESEYITGSQWALIPTKGSYRATANRRFFNLGRLRGHEGPELRLENATGVYLGGGSVAPFEGSFATDSAKFRGRIISGGLGWNPEYGLISDGDGVLVTTP